MLKKNWRWIAFGFGLLALVVLGLRPTKVAVEIAEVAVAPLEVTLDEEGQTRVRQRFMVSAPVSGKVERIVLEPGDRVVAGDTVIAIFRPTTPVLLDARSKARALAAVASAEAALGRANADRQKVQGELDFARAELARYKSLATGGIVSQGQLDQTALAVTTGDEALVAGNFVVRTAESELRAAHAQLLQVSSSSEGDIAIAIHSPIDGVVLRRLHESEAVVLVGEPLVEVGDTTDLEIVADFLSSDAVRMKVGYRALIERWGGQPILAQVRRIELSGFTKISALGVEEQRVNVVLDLDQSQRDLWHNLGDGFRVEVRVVVWADDQVLGVPTGALFRSDGQWAVYVVVDGKAELRTIEIGARNAGRAEVLSGLEQAEKVIMHPGDAVEHGTSVVWS